MPSANMVLLEKITVGAAGAASVTFNNIPQTGYTDLKIVYSARGLASATDRGMFVQFNGDTTSSYTYKFLRGDGSSAGSGGTTTTFLYWGNFPAASATANTFGNGEFYIPNYTSSNYKSVSSDSVSENNATAGWDTLAAGLWSKTNAITSMLLYPESGNFAQYSTFSLYGLAAVGATPAINPKATGGDIIQTDGTYWYHAFINSGNFVPKANLTADVLVVAGGGGGCGGGGGAGGVLYQASNSLVNSTSYVATIGAGGAGGSAGYPIPAASNGVDSSLIGGAVSKTATGGGGGGGYNSSAATSAGANGGSGGGGGGIGSGLGTTYGGTGVSGQGYAGGTNGGNNNSPYSSGGGGGAGGVGGNAASSTSAGTGGAGTNAYSSWLSAVGLGVSGYIAGGGGGGSYSTGATPGAGGSGGGGAGSSAGNGTNGTPNTGGGGGGGNATQATGGSGLVIVRYAI